MAGAALAVAVLGDCALRWELESPFLKCLKMQRPNILFLTVDQLRTDALGSYGGRWSRTPHIDALAARGVRFDQAYASAPECVPSRATWLTGLYPLEHGAVNNYALRFPGMHPLLYRAASEVGYTVAVLGKTHYQPDLTEQDRINLFWPYWNTVPATGADTWRAPNRFPNQTLEALLVRAFGAAIEYNAHAYYVRKPWFVHLSFVNPHPPKLCENLPIGWRPLPKERCPMPRLTAAEADEHSNGFAEAMMEARQCYGSTVEYVDAMVGEALKFVDFRNTLVLFVSDHGDMIGDHGVRQKSVFFDAAWRVPLVLAGVGVKPRPNGLETNFACGADVPMTLRRAMGARLSPMHRGVDLRVLEHVAKTAECRGFLQTRDHGMVAAIVNSTIKAVRNKTHILQVFNRTLGVDPFEMNNLAQLYFDA